MGIVTCKEKCAAKKIRVQMFDIDRSSRWRFGMSRGIILGKKLSVDIRVSDFYGFLI
jgi:hypothetical protein